MCVMLGTSAMLCEVQISEMYTSRCAVQQSLSVRGVAWD